MSLCYDHTLSHSFARSEKEKFRICIKDTNSLILLPKSEMLFSEYILLDKEACLLAIKRRDKCINAEFLKGIPGNAAE